MMDVWKQYTIIVVSMAVAFVLGVAVLPFVISSIINGLLPPSSPPFLAVNQTDLFKQLQKQQLDVEKNVAKYPCSGGGGFNPRPGVLCPEDNNMTRLFHSNGTV